MRDGFTFGKYSTWDFKMHAEKYPKQIGAKRRRETYQVPGMNGDLHSIEETFENYIQPYECYFHGEAPTTEQAHAIKAWLASNGNYKRLWDVYDPDHFRLATFAGPLDISNILNEYGRCTVNFDCAPQSFLVSGERTIAFATAGTLWNPTEFDAKPIIKVTGTEAGELHVNGTTIIIKAFSAPIIFDCETQNAYSEVEGSQAVNQNGNISAPTFPVLSSGGNNITFEGGVTKVEIKPRWWEL